MPVELTIEQENIRDFARIIKTYEDGKQLRRRLLKEFRGVMEPVTGEIESRLMGMGGQFGDSPSLRSEIASQLKVEARLSGRNTGIRVRVKKTEGVREFTHAPKRVNSRTGWRRRVFGGDTFIQQIGAPGFFDDPIEERRDESREAALMALEGVAKEIASRTDQS